MIRLMMLVVVAVFDVTFGSSLSMKPYSNDSMYVV